MTHTTKQKELLETLSEGGNYDREIFELLVQPTDYMAVHDTGVSYRTMDDPYGKEIRPFSVAIASLLKAYKYNMTAYPEVSKNSLKVDLAAAKIRMNSLLNAQEGKHKAELKGIPQGDVLDSTIIALENYIGNLMVLERLSNE